MNTGVSPEALQAIAHVLFANTKVKGAKIFGSRAVGTYSNGSDIDICLFGEELTINDVLRLQSQLYDLNIPQIIDLVNFNSIKNENLIRHIEQKALSLVA
jgi:predicted nucleotidyltransferase